MSDSSDDLTGRVLFQRASRAIPKYNSTPLRVLEPEVKKRSTKRPRSAMTISRPSGDLPLENLVKGTCKEKITRKSSPFALENYKIFNSQHEKSKSRRSLYAPVHLDEEISVEENDITRESSILPDIADISAIAGCHKKPKLRLGKLDNRAYIKQMQKKRSQTVNESPLEEEYDPTSFNPEESSAALSCQGSSRAVSHQTKWNTFDMGSDNSLSDKDCASDVNFNTDAVKDSPLSDKKSTFSEKRIPHLSSDSDATLPSFPFKPDVRQKSRVSVMPNITPNVLSFSHPVPSSGKLISPVSRRPSSKNQSSVKTLQGKNNLSHSWQLEGLHVPPFSTQRAETSKPATVSRREASSGSSDADEECPSEEEESVEEDQNVFPPEDAGDSEEELETAAPAVHKSTSRNLLSQHSTKVTSPTSIRPGTQQVSLRDSRASSVEEPTGNLNVTTFNDPIQFIDMPKATTPSGQQKSVSRNSLPQHGKKSTASRSKSYKTIDRNSIAVQGTPRVFEDAMLQMQRDHRISGRKTVSASRNASKLSRNRSLDIVEPPIASEVPVSLSQKKSSQTSLSQGSVKAASASLPCNIINRENTTVHSTSHDIPHDSSPISVEEPEEYQDESFSKGAVKELKTSKTATLLQQKSASRISASRSTTTRSSYNIINPPNIDMSGSPQVLEDGSYQVPHRTKANVSRKMSRTSKMSELGQLTSPSLSIRPSVSGSIKKKMHSTAIDGHSDTIETIQASSPISLSQILQQADIPGRKTGNVSIKSSRTTKSSWETVQENSEVSEDDSYQVPHQPEVSGKKTRSASRNASHATDMSELEQPTNPASSVRSDSTKKKIVGRKTGSASKKVKHSTKMSRSERLTGSPLPLKSSISNSLRNKMHSTGITYHNATMKTFQGDSVSVSPIRNEVQEILGSGKIHREPASADHIDSSAEEVESSVASSSESEPSPVKVRDKELSLPAAVQNHDEEPLTEEDEVAASAPPQQKRHAKKKKTGMPRISAAETKRTIEHYAGMKISKGALNTVLESCDIFWENTFAALHDYANHANRKEIDVPDIELLLYRQRLAHDRDSMNALIAQYMPMELRREVIPMATPGNIVIP